MGGDEPQDGLARSISPVYTLFDGDAVFALASGDMDAEPSIVEACTADAVAKTVRRAVLLAEGTGESPPPSGNSKARKSGAAATQKRKAPRRGPSSRLALAAWPQLATADAAVLT